jgi:hypothetical protein
VNDEIFNWSIGDMLEVTFDEYDTFLKIKETLTRIGVASRKEQILYPSCNILHKKGRYFIVSFKELFCLDGKSTNLTWNDIERRNTIATLLQEWGMLTIVDASKVEHQCPVSQIKIIPFREKANWKIVPKYTLGNSIVSK